jgi:hypothetical protein
MAADKSGGACHQAFLLSAHARRIKATPTRFVEGIASRARAESQPGATGFATASRKEEANLKLALPEANP